jgi:hypothetical protein
MHLIQLEASKRGARLFRNNVGLFTTLDGRKVKTGLCKGSSDLIGWFRGQFLAVEVKIGKGKPTPEQIAFVNQVNADGGIGMIVYSVDEFLEKLVT